MEKGDDCLNLVWKFGAEMAGHNFWAHTGVVMKVESCAVLFGMTCYGRYLYSLHHFDCYVPFYNGDFDVEDTY